MATQTVEEGGTQFQLPGGMLMAEDASVQEHMASHSLAVEQAAAASNTRSDEASDKRTGVPEELLKKLPVMTFGDAVSRDHKELLPKASDSKDTIKPALESTTQDDCPCCESRAPRIPGLQIDSEEDDRTCEICQSCYEWNEEVLVLPCNHFFHKGCVTRWLEMRKTCPKCRYQVAPSDEADEAEGQGVIVRRTTTIEWVPVVRWVPSSSTTVEVRSAVGSDTETVTTTTTRNTSINPSQIAHATLPQATNHTQTHNLRQAPPNSTRGNNNMPHPAMHNNIANGGNNANNSSSNPSPMPSPPLFTHANRLSILQGTGPSVSPQQAQQPLADLIPRRSSSHSPRQNWPHVPMPPLGPSARMIQQNSGPSAPSLHTRHGRTFSFDSNSHSPHQQYVVMQVEPRSPNVPSHSMGSITPPLMPRGPLIGVPPMGDIVETTTYIVM